MQKKQNDELVAVREKAYTLKRTGKLHVGYVTAALGYRQIDVSPTSTGRLIHLDWALINVVLSRLGRNEITTYGTPKFGLAPGEFVQGDEMPLLGAPLFKIGRTTEWTRGSYSELRSAHIHTFISGNREAVVVT